MVKKQPENDLVKQKTFTIEEVREIALYFFNDAKTDTVWHTPTETRFDYLWASKDLPEI